MRYSSHLSIEAATTIIGLRRRLQRKALALADALAEQPFAPGDYQTYDSEGRAIEHVLADGFLLSYWVDHSCSEVRIIEVVRV